MLTLIASDGVPDTVIFISVASPLYNLLSGVVVFENIVDVWLL